MKSRRFATLDIGTNSVLLLIVERRAGELVPCSNAQPSRAWRRCRPHLELGAGAKERTLACIRAYADYLARFGVTRVAAVGTSALRDARGGQEFARDLERVLGVVPSVIDAAAKPSSRFAARSRASTCTARSRCSTWAAAAPRLSVGHATAPKQHPPCGESRYRSVRLHERHVSTDPATPSELAAVVSDIDAALARVPEPPTGATRVGVAGTVTTLASVALELEDYDPTIVHGHALTRDAVAKLVAKLGSMPLAERRTLRGLDPRRADVIVAGSLIVERVMGFAEREVLIVSDRGVRFGLAEELAGGDG